MAGSGIAAIGLRARTARAIAVVLAGPPASPKALFRAELSLASPAIPATAQPYHEVMDLPWDEALEAVRQAETAIEGLASAALRHLLRDPRLKDVEVRGVGIVGAPERDLRSISNPHIRAHAAEGVLFRRVLQVAALSAGLPQRTFVEKGLEALAGTKLKMSPASIRRRLADFGAALGRPWRAEEKLAATAAWLSFAHPATD